MTRLLEQAIEAVRQLSPEEQDEIAQAILSAVNDDELNVYVLSDEENAAIERSRRAIARGEFATEDQVAAVLSKYRR